MSDDLTVPQIDLIRRIAAEVATAIIDKTLLKIWATLGTFAIIIVVQLVTIVWIGGGKVQMVQDNHDAIAALIQYQHTTAASNTLLQTQMATVNANLASMNQRLTNIETNTRRNP